MRLKNINQKKLYRILLVDDEPAILKSIKFTLEVNGYSIDTCSDPLVAIDLVKGQNYELLILDYLMSPIHGDKVVEKIREFNKEIYILLLTGHSSLVPPLETIQRLDIQGYCEKSERYDQLLLLVASAIKSIDMMNTIKTTRDGLNKILQSVPKVYQLQPINNILQEILLELMPMLKAEDAFILIDNIIDLDNNIVNGTLYNGIGAYLGGLDNISVELLEHIGYVRTLKEIRVIGNSVLLPLISEKYDTLGVIYVSSGNIDDESLKLLQIYSSIVSSSISNALLHRLINIKNEELDKQREQLALWYIETVRTIRLTINFKDEYTCDHSDRVAEYAVKIGKAFNLSEKELELLKNGGIFHDVGKIGTEDAILKKTSSLDDAEYYEIKKHSERGAMILSAVSMFRDVVPLVLYHHERYDGKGYPKGLKGNDIPFLAKIITVADSFDAMTTDRKYRSKLPMEAVINELKNNKGKQFDPEIVDKFIELIEKGEIKI